MPLRDNQRLDQLLIQQPHARPTLRDARDAGESLLKRAALLLPDDRALVELAIRNSASHRTLARMLNQPAGTVTRRLRRIMARLYDPIVVALLDALNPLPPEYRQLGVEHLLQGRSMRDLAEHHEMPVGKVRAMLDQIRGWHRARTARPNWSTVHHSLDA
jgi:DNA-directed RNA polymerase specialized sigma24 family protein